MPRTLARRLLRMLLPAVLVLPVLAVVALLVLGIRATPPAWRPRASALRPS
jgi:hypothetical protein